MEDTRFSNFGDDLAPEDRHKTDWMGGTPRKGLGDITNLQQKRRLSSAFEKSQLVSIVAKEQIDQLNKEKAKFMKQVEQLVKEKMALMKQIDDRNKIIELSRNEVQKLRMNNFHLAQANSQMLAEVTADKAKLKELRHELECVRSLLRFKDSELQDKRKTRMYLQSGSKMQAAKTKGAGSSQTDLSCGSKGRRLSKVEVPSTVNDAATAEKTENRRRSSRRQSAPFNSEEQESTEDSFDNKRHSLKRKPSVSRTEAQEPSEDLFEIDIMETTACPELDEKHYDPPASLPSQVCSDDTGNTSVDGSASQENRRRSSVGRPLRQAAVKVHTYKEMSLNKKMRRES